MAALSLAEQQRLVDALLRIDTVRMRYTRDSCIAGLERNLVRPIHWVRQDQDRYDVWEMVTACLDRPGALHALLEAVEILDQGSHAFIQARELVDTLLAEPLLTTQERKDLGGLVHKLEEGLRREQLGDIVNAYYMAAGPMGPHPTKTDADDPQLIRVQRLIEDLEALPLNSDGVAPLLIFVHCIAGYATGVTATAFTEWMDRFAERRGLDEGWRERLPSVPDVPSLRAATDGDAPGLAGTGQESYLVIDCQEHGARPGEYVVDAWLEYPGDPGHVRLRGDDAAVPVAGLPAVVEEVLACDRWPPALEPEPIIEFVVPYGLLTHPYDQFMIGIDRIRRRLGVEYPVVLRSRERLERHRMRANWRRKSRLLRHPAGARVCRLHEPGELDQERLFALLSGPDAVGLALPYPPAVPPPSPPEAAPEPGPAPDTGLGDSDVLEELWVALTVGVPIVIWCRECVSHRHFTEEMDELIGSDLMSLPRRVHEMRRQAIAGDVQPAALTSGGGQSLGDGGQSLGDVGDEPSLGRHIALLFDDADRIEPYERFKPPAV